MQETFETVEGRSFDLLCEQRVFFLLLRFCNFGCKECACREREEERANERENEEREREERAKRERKT